MLKIINPATGAQIKEVPTDNQSSIAEKFRRSQVAQPIWAAAPLAQRLEVIRKFRGILEQDKEDLARTLTSEVGKPISQSRNEIQGTLGRIDFFLENTPGAIKDQTV